VAQQASWFIAWVIVTGLSAILTTAATLASYTVVLCCLIPLVAAPLRSYVALVRAALFGQAYRGSTADS
jgi:hypothetical protein